MSLPNFTADAVLSTLVSYYTQALSLPIPHGDANLDLLQRLPNLMLNHQLIQNLIVERIKNQLLFNAVINSTQQVSLLRNPPPEKTLIAASDQPPMKNDSPTIKEEKEVSKGVQEQPEEEEESRPILRKLRKRTKITFRECFEKKCSNNETKNIPKNFGKAIAAFIQREQKLTRQVLKLFPELDYAQFILDIRQRRRIINSIADLRSLWITEENPFAPPTRILSSIFLKKHSLKYIFRSRVTYYEGHIKYRTRLLEALRNPQTFYSIKEY